VAVSQFHRHIYVERCAYVYVFIFIYIYIYTRPLIYAIYINTYAQVYIYLCVSVILRMLTCTYVNIHQMLLIIIIVIAINRYDLLTLSSYCVIAKGRLWQLVPVCLYLIYVRGLCLSNMSTWPIHLLQ
jgi:hypothetical protein